MMEKGKISEAVLKRSVIGRLKGHRPEVISGSAVGEDCAVLKLSGDEVFVMSSDPITAAEKNAGKLAVDVTANDLASAGAEPVAILLTMLLPDGADEELLKELMDEVNSECERLSMTVAGGHTEVTDAVTKPLLSVTGVGKARAGKVVLTSGASPDEDIIVTKAVGLEGTAIIASEHEDELLTRLPSELIDRAKSFIDDICVVKEGLIAAEYGVSSMHDITEGGIFGALWEMAEASGTGLSVDLSKIPVRQETIEICEFYGIDPYRLTGSGSLLISTKDGNGLIERLAKENIPASYIGRMTAEHARIVRYSGGEKYLTPPDTDELHFVGVKR